VRKVTISLAPHLHALAISAGESEGTSFSGYLAKLIVSDLRSRGGDISSGAATPAPAPDPLAAMVREMEDEVRPIVARVKGAGKPQASNDDKKHKAAKH
jgi:hypothetical protein